MSGAEDPGALEALARHGEALATVRAFAERSQSLRVVVIVDQGDAFEPAMLDRAADGTVELTEAGRAWTIPVSTPVPVPPRSLPDIRPAPSSALRADPATGEPVSYTHLTLPTTPYV